MKNTQLQQCEKIKFMLQFRRKNIIKNVYERS